MRIRMNLVKGVATSIVFLILLLLSPVSSPDRAAAQEKTPEAPPGAPKLNAGSWTLIDADTGHYLAGKNPDEQVSIASTTKIMVALVALDEGVDLDEQVRSRRTQPPTPAPSSTATSASTPTTA